MTTRSKRAAPTPPCRPAAGAPAPAEDTAKPTRWAAPGWKEGGKTREDDAPKSATPPGEGWGDKGRETSGYRRGGVVKAPPLATIDATRSAREYP
jgi:hypothetical protein